MKKKIIIIIRIKILKNDKSNHDKDNDKSDKFAQSSSFPRVKTTVVMATPRPELI